MGQWGLFTTRRVRASERLAFFSGTVDAPIVVAERPRSLAPLSKVIGSGVYMEDGGTNSPLQQQIGCYANSARSDVYFNAILVLSKRRGSKNTRRYEVDAVRDIEAGHEVLVDYGAEYWEGTGIDVSDPWWAPSGMPDDGGEEQASPEETLAYSRRSMVPAEPSAREVADTPAAVREAIDAVVREIVRQVGVGDVQIVVFAGAGTSTASGVPDVRGRAARGSQGMTTAGERQVTGTAPLVPTGAAPGKSHFALAALARAGYISLVTSMNIDGLDHRAGVPPRNLVEIHGSAVVCECEACHGRFRTREDMRETAGHNETGQLCPDCAGSLRATVLPMHGIYDDVAYARVRAANAAATMRMYLGTSMSIEAINGFGFPLVGGTVRPPTVFTVLCNLGELPQRYVAHANVSVRTDVGGFLEAICKRLGVVVKTEEVPVGEMDPIVAEPPETAPADAGSVGEKEVAPAVADDVIGMRAPDYNASSPPVYDGDDESLTPQLGAWEATGGGNVRAEFTARVSPGNMVFAVMEDNGGKLLYDPQVFGDGDVSTYVTIPLPRTGTERVYVCFYGETATYNWNYRAGLTSDGGSWVLTAAAVRGNVPAIAAAEPDVDMLDAVGVEMSPVPDPAPAASASTPAGVEALEIDSQDAAFAAVLAESRRKDAADAASRRAAAFAVALAEARRKDAADADRRRATAAAVALAEARRKDAADAEARRKVLAGTQPGPEVLEYDTSDDESSAAPAPAASAPIPAAAAARHPFPTLSRTQNAEVDAALDSTERGSTVPRYPAGTMTFRDVWTLRPDADINDQIIDSYMSLLVERFNTPASPCCALSTQLYPALLLGGSRVERFTRNVDIFLYARVLVPFIYVDEWCLAVISPRMKHVGYYDGLARTNDESQELLLRWIRGEWGRKGHSAESFGRWGFATLVPRAVQERGRHDSGIFVCRYAECACRGALPNFEQRDMPQARRVVAYEIIKHLILPPP
jgi:sentrin-specific protease 1